MLTTSDLALSYFNSNRSVIPVHPKTLELVYGALLLALAKQKNVVEAEKIFSQMKADKVFMSEKAYQVIIGLCSITGNKQRAYELAKELQESGLSNKSTTAEHKVDGQ